MIILGIETSCDETSLALIEVDEDRKEPTFRVLSHVVLSQTIHNQYGGVFPMMAKREHARTLIPLFKKIVEESGFVSTKSEITNPKQIPNSNIQTILNREPELLAQFLEYIPTIEKPAIDVIAVTEGPGLEPALWVGINFAVALGAIWNIPVIPVNHMEGHIFAALLERAEDVPRHYTLNAIRFPSIALLISGGHTELVLIKNFQEYEIVGETQDDAVGEAFDKIARILGLPYPGGPEISSLAEKARRYTLTAKRFPLPRPMLKSPDLNFSFSGLKTAVLYTVKKLPSLTEEDKIGLALETENAITEVLVEKTRKAIEQYGTQSLIVAGGVIANKHIREEFGKLAEKYSIPLLIPRNELSTDNALMIAIAGYYRLENKSVPRDSLKARGTLRLQA